MKMKIFHLVCVFFLFSWFYWSIGPSHDKARTTGPLEESFSGKFQLFRRREKRFYMNGFKLDMKLSFLFTGQKRVYTKTAR